MSNFVTILPDAITSNDATEKVPAGSRAFVDGKLYEYVKFDNGSGNVAAAANSLAYWLTSSTHLVTSDYSDNPAALNGVAGVFMTALTDGYYGWILVNGDCLTLKTNGDDDITAGDSLIASTTDGACNSVAANTAPTNRVVGFAMANDVDADDTVHAYITLE